MTTAHLDPIAAIATAAGRGAVGIVRVSGVGLAPYVQALLGRSLQPRHAHYLPFPDAQGQPIDQGLALFFPAPHSYTGEDVLELQAHGGSVWAESDGGVNTFPDLEKKADILENAAMCFQALGYETINAACICGAEQVNPKIQSTVDADALAHMTDRWAKYHMNVCGPVALDLAVSPEACRHKHYSAPGAGMADILLVPNYEVGNGIGKAAGLFGHAKNAGIILGAKVPIVLVSRSDSAYSKLASIAAGSVLAERMNLA